MQEMQETRVKSHQKHKYSSKVQIPEQNLLKYSNKKCVLGYFAPLVVNAKICGFSPFAVCKQQCHAAVLPRRVCVCVLLERKKIVYLSYFFLNLLSSRKTPLPARLITTVPETRRILADLQLLGSNQPLKCIELMCKFSLYMNALQPARETTGMERGWKLEACGTKGNVPQNHFHVYTLHLRDRHTKSTK